MSNLKILDLTKPEEAGEFELLEPGKRFLFKNQEVDIRKISRARAEQLAADPLCKFLGKKGVNKFAEPAPAAPAPAAPVAEAPAKKDRGAKTE